MNIDVNYMYMNVISQYFFPRLIECNREKHLLLLHLLPPACTQQLQQLQLPSIWTRTLDGETAVWIKKPAPSPAILVDDSHPQVWSRSVSSQDADIAFGNDKMSSRWVFLTWSQSERYMAHQFWQTTARMASNLQLFREMRTKISSEHPKSTTIRDRTIRLHWCPPLNCNLAMVPLKSGSIILCNPAALASKKQPNCISRNKRERGSLPVRVADLFNLLPAAVLTLFDSTFSRKKSKT